MTDRFDAMNLFIRVARTRSFSVAARERGVSQPTVSRAIAGLEKELGVALFARTPRAVTLTEAGTDYFARVEIVLKALDEATDAVRGTGVLSGMLRIGASSSFSQRVLIPRLPNFMSAHPRLRVNLLSDDQRLDLIAQGIDVALRFGVLEDSSRSRPEGPLLATGCCRISQLPLGGRAPGVSGRPRKLSSVRWSFRQWIRRDIAQRRPDFLRQGR